ncbi:hypothetical protein BFAG_02036 [Bacteroides fragilis 3_1_12]|uniref:Uncharacterized protein n=1 Tax=Bacteroides fragilis 3_1_12 TaxID=457424 RepID=A0ABN0BKC6_BACFG|nr:hypothetical protein BFAG_02036 [Bacteroides fragilis 3_1_12]
MLTSYKDNINFLKARNRSSLIIQSIFNHKTVRISYTNAIFMRTTFLFHTYRILPLF